MPAVREGRGGQRDRQHLVIARVPGNVLTPGADAIRRDLADAIGVSLADTTGTSLIFDAANFLVSNSRSNCVKVTVA